MKKIYLKLDWKSFHPKTFEPWTKMPLSGKYVHDSKISSEHNSGGQPCAVRPK